MKKVITFLLALAVAGSVQAQVAAAGAISGSSSDSSSAAISAASSNQHQGQMQGQGQGQGQQQGLVSTNSSYSAGGLGGAGGDATALGGNSTALGGTSKATGGTSGAVSGAANAGNSQSINISSPGAVEYKGSYTVKSAPGVVTPQVYPTAPCMGSSAVGGSGIGFGFSVGTSWKDDECGIRETARSFVSLGLPVDAIKVLCTSAYAAAAPSCSEVK